MTDSVFVCKHDAPGFVADKVSSLFVVVSLHVELKALLHGQSELTRNVKSFAPWQLLVPHLYILCSLEFLKESHPGLGALQCQLWRR